MIKIILDTDPGVGIPGTDADDPIAILLALAHPDLQLLGITTTFGNCPPELGARGAKAVLAAAGRTDIPVRVGQPMPLGGSLPGDLEEVYRGTRGTVGRIALPELEAVDRSQTAADFIIEQAHAHPGEVTIVAIGPQTNLALAMQKDPSVRGLLRSIVFMGGALGLDPRYGRGNVTSVAECNIWYDPEAADAVFRSGVDLTMVSLDVTNPAMGMVLPDEVARSLRTSAGPVEAMLAWVCETYLDAPMFDWAHGCVLYDPLAVAAAADPALGAYEEIAVAVELSGDYTRGQTVPVRENPPNLRAMVDVDGASAVGDMVRTILTLDSSPQYSDRKAQQ